MCGIIGIVKLKNQIRQTELNSLSNALDKMAYRGPDHKGLWNDERVALGHRRLSIIDLSEAGNQPFRHHQKNIEIVFNGEIYNYLELKNDLLQKGHRFTTTSDTEVILASYIQYGGDFVSRLNGMFAFCLYDKEQNKVILGRDRLGKKPLYYYQDAERFIFSSEIKFLHAFADVPLEISPQSLATYLYFQYVPAPQTIYTDVYCLSQGRVLTIDLNKGSITQKSYWEIADTLKAKPQALTLDECDEILEQSVKYRLIADVDVALLLSGGIDSTLLAYYASKLSNAKIKAYSVIFKNASLDESRYSKMVAENLGIELIQVEGDSVSEQIFDSCVYHADQPLGDSAMIPTYIISKEVSKYVKVVLSGEGADELFHGYKYYEREEMLQKIEHTWPGRLAFNLSGMLPDFLFGDMAYRLNKIHEMPARIGVPRWTTVFDLTCIGKIVKNLPEHSVTGHLLKMNAQWHRMEDSSDTYNAALMMDLVQWLPDDLLVKIDRMTMAHSLEARAPFLDYKVVERLMRLPISEKKKFFGNKKPLRDLILKNFKNETGSTIAGRRKQGFEVPKVKWLTSDLMEVAKEAFSDENLKKIPFLNADQVSIIWKEFLISEQKEVLERRVWSLFVLLTWYKHHQNKFGF